MSPDAPPADDVRFLLRSANRLDVLSAVHDAPRTRHELREATGSSRVTVSRILGDLEERSWVDRVGDRYEATARGSVVAREVTRTFENLAAVDTLGETLSWLPVERFDFELSRLADATVVTPTERDLTATVTLVSTRVREAERVRNVAPGISAEVVDAYLESARREGHRLETVLGAPVVELAREDPDLRGRVAELCETDRVTVRRYDGDEATTLVTICDDVVLFCGQPEGGSVPQAVETTDEAVREWAASHVDAIWSAARPLEFAAFTP